MQNESVKHVSWFRLFWKHMLWLPISVILFGGGVMYGSWFFGRDRARLDRDGFETTATITRLEGRVPQYGQQSSRHLYVHYSFHPGPGKFANGRSPVSTETFRGLRVGQTINIRAVSELPFISEYEHSTRPNHILWGYLIGGGVGCCRTFHRAKAFQQVLSASQGNRKRFCRTRGGHPASGGRAGFPSMRFLAYGWWGRGVVAEVISPGAARGWRNHFCCGRYLDRKLVLGERTLSPCRRNLRHSLPSRRHFP